MQRPGAFVSQLLSKVEVAKLAKQESFTLPVEDLLRLLDMYYDAQDEVGDLNDEIRDLIRARNEVELEADTEVEA